MNRISNDDKGVKSNTLRCYLGLGSNLTNQLGTPSQHIKKAVQTLVTHSDVHHVRTSSLYASKPMGPQDQPDFINAVVELDTTLSSQALLELCQYLEQQAERVRLRHWGERSLDVDVLLYGDKQIKTSTLTVPHAGILERNFVLVPLAELNPDLKILGKPIKNIPMSQNLIGLSRLS